MDRKREMVTHAIFFFQPVSTSLITKLTNAYCTSGVFAVVTDLLTEGLIYQHHGHWADSAVAYYKLTPIGVQITKNLMHQVDFPVVRASKANYLELLRLREGGFLLDRGFAKRYVWSCTEVTSKEDFQQLFTRALELHDFPAYCRRVAGDNSEASREVEQLFKHPRLGQRHQKPLYLQYLYYDMKCQLVEAHHTTADPGSMATPQT